MVRRQRYTLYKTLWKGTSQVQKKVSDRLIASRSYIADPGLSVRALSAQATILGRSLVPALLGRLIFNVMVILSSLPHIKPSAIDERPRGIASIAGQRVDDRSEGVEQPYELVPGRRIGE
ncbi:MAG TPA: hypothetical protein VNT30_04520 [Stellaceae bacterium]|nr:hypothetical protein [Stellaceae bacterium]